MAQLECCKTISLVYASDGYWQTGGVPALRHMLWHIGILSQTCPHSFLFSFSISVSTKPINKCDIKAKKWNQKDRFQDAIEHRAIIRYIDWLLQWIVQNLLIPLSQFLVFFFMPHHTPVFLLFFHRDEMKSLQAALQKQLDDAAGRAEKQQATVRC